MEYPSKKKKGKNKGKIASTKHSKLCDGRWEIIIEGKLKCVSLGDIGADFSAFPRSVITALDCKGISVKHKKLPQPMSLQAMIKLPKSVSVTRSETAEFSIALSLLCGPLRLRRVLFYIIETKTDEILLGRRFLRTLRFGLSIHLRDMKEKIDGADVASTTERGLNINNVCVDATKRRFPWLSTKT